MYATIKDVAKKAGVSIATISRAFNDSPYINQETKKAIIKIAQDLKYTPNPMARGLTLRKTNTLGVILPDLYGDFFSEVIKGIDEITRENGYQILVASSHSNKNEIEVLFKLMRGGRVDGLIIMSPHLDSHTLEKNFPINLPIVLSNCFCDDSSRNSIIINNYNGAFNMVNHLIKHGHKKIAIIKGVDNNYDAEERYRGYLTAMRKSKLEINPNYVLKGNFTEESGYDSIRKILKEKFLPSAIFASNDSMAIGAMSALHEAGLRIPKDIAIAGFDDISISKYMKPSLTSVHVPIFKLGKIAAAKLIRLINNEQKKIEKNILQTTLITRESCGCNNNIRITSKK